jgi:YVTN family beta-propeller protein
MRAVNRAAGVAVVFLLIFASVTAGSVVGATTVGFGQGPRTQSATGSAPVESSFGLVPNDGPNPALRAPSRSSLDASAPSDPIAVGSDPWGVAYDPGTNEVFVANIHSDNLSVISDTTDHVVATIPVGSDPEGVAYDPGTNEVFVANHGSNNVSVISDTTEGVVATVPVGNYPIGVAYDAGTHEVFVATSGPNPLNYGNVSIISDATDTVVATVPVGTIPYGVAYDSGKKEVFVTNVVSSSVSVISDATDTVVATVPLGPNPTYPGGAAYDPRTNEVFVANKGTNDVSVISDTTDRVVATVPVGSDPDGVAYDPGMQEVFVTNVYSNNVSVISDTTDQDVATVPVGSIPDGITYDSGTNEIFVANGASNNVTVVSVSHLAYAVTFMESGLMTKSAERKLAKWGWTVILNGTSESSTTNTITFRNVTNGVYPVLITGPSGTEASGSGPATVRGVTDIAVTLTVGKTVTLTYAEKGLTKGTNWCMALDNATECSGTASIKFVNLTPGPENRTGDEYSCSVVSPTVGQHLASSANATITLTKSTKIVETFAYEYAVTFSETGLSSRGWSGGWTVWVDGVPGSNASDGPITFHLVNGTYRYKVGAIPGCRSVGTPTKVKVEGLGVPVTVTFTQKP